MKIITKTELMLLIAKLGLRPGKFLGQNFMIDENMLDFIVRTAAPAPSDCVLEVGPGFGALTKRLVGKVSELYAVELDIKLFSYLQSEIADPSFHLIRGNALKMDIKALFGGREFRIISNLPYAISTPFVLNVIESGAIPSGMHLVLQEETADRFCAMPREPDYGASSVLVQIFFEIEKIRRIPPEVFHPAPEVGSAFVSFSRRAVLPGDDGRRNLFRVVKAAFSRRRKMLANNLSAIFAKDRAVDILRQLSLSPNVRAEELPPGKYMEIAKFAELS